MRLLKAREVRNTARDSLALYTETTKPSAEYLQAAERFKVAEETYVDLAVRETGLNGMYGITLRSLQQMGALKTQTQIHEAHNGGTHQAPIEGWVSPAEKQHTQTLI